MSKLDAVAVALQANEIFWFITAERRVTMIGKRKENVFKV